MAAKKGRRPAPEDLDAVLASIRKDFGDDGVIMRLGEANIGPIEVIDSGSIALNRALGVGGFPKGRVIEIYGPEGSGKTTLALHAIATCQAKGQIAAFIDAEHALDPVYAQGIGVDTETLLVSQPDNGEQGLEVAMRLLRSTKVDIIVIDSVAALVPRAEIEGEMGDATVGAQARLMGQALRKMTAEMSNKSATVIFINQLRQKIGVVFGPSETTSGGKALPFFASVRLDVRRIETLKAGSPPVAVGSRLRVKVVKNKVSPPFRVAEFDLYFGRGISPEAEIFDHGLVAGLITKAGNACSLGGEHIGMGRGQSIEWLAQNPEKAAALREQLVELMSQASYSPTAPASPPLVGRGKAPLS